MKGMFSQLGGCWVWVKSMPSLRQTSKPPPPQKKKKKKKNFCSIHAIAEYKVSFRRLFDLSLFHIKIPRRINESRLLVFFNLNWI